MDTPARPDLQACLDKLADQVGQRGLPREVVEQFRRFPRHRFMRRMYFTDEATGRYRDEPVEIPDEPTDPAQLHAIYEDHALAIQVRHGVCLSSTTQPSLMATMMTEAQVRPGGRVLEIGTATGWNAALMSGLVGDDGRVVTIEIDPELASEAARRLASQGCGQVEVICGDGYHGAPDHGLFDSILVTVAVPHLAPAWLDQLAPGGTLLAPVELPDGASPLVAFHGGLNPVGQFGGLTWFVPVRGGLWHSWPPPLKPDTSPALAATIATRERRLRWPWGRGASGPVHGFLVYLAAQREPGLAAIDFRAENPRERRKIGLWQSEPPGLAVIDGDALVAYGEAGPERRMLALAQDFYTAGCPSMQDWRLTWHEPAPYRLGPPGAPSIGLTRA